MKINDLYKHLKNKKYEKEFNLNISYSKKEKSIYYHNKNGLLILSILENDEKISSFKFYSDISYEIVKLELVDEYLNYLFKLLYKKWS